MTISSDIGTTGRIGIAKKQNSFENVKFFHKIVARTVKCVSQNDANGGILSLHLSILRHATCGARQRREARRGGGMICPRGESHAPMICRTMAAPAESRLSAARRTAAPSFHTVPAARRTAAPCDARRTGAVVEKSDIMRPAEVHQDIENT